MKALINYFLFYLFVITFLLILLVFDLIQRLAVPFGLGVVDYAIYYFNYSILLALRIVGCKLEVSGEKDLPSEGPAIIISNHQSMFDIPSIHFALRGLRPRFISKQELGRGIPGVSTCLRVSQAALIDRSDANQALAEIEKFGSFLKREKVSGVIFPEGTRARDGALKQFKKRGINSLLQNTWPCWVIPLTIDGSWKLQNKKFGPIPYGVKIRLNIGKPIFVSSPDQIPEIGTTIFNLISQNLENLRK